MRVRTADARDAGAGRRHRTPGLGLAAEAVAGSGARCKPRISVQSGRC